MDYRIAKESLIFYNLVNLFTAQNRLKIGAQIPTEVQYITHEGVVMGKIFRDGTDTGKRSREDTVGKA